MNTASDEDVVKSVLNGKSRDFIILVERYQNSLIGFAAKHFCSTSQVNDLVQEALLISYRDLSKLKDPKKFKSWAFGITYRQCLLFSRKVKTENKNLKQFASSTDTKYQMEISIENSCESKFIPLLDKLSQMDSLLVWLHYIEELPYQEIASMVEMNVATIRQRCRRALMKMREMLP